MFDLVVFGLVLSCGVIDVSPLLLVLA